MSGAEEHAEEQEHEECDEHEELTELPLSSVTVDWAWNSRGEPTEEEVAAAVALFEREPMLHAPSVAPMRDGGYRLVTGFMRFEVMCRQGREQGWFRVVRGSEKELCLWNLSENTARRSLSGFELVERVWLLEAHGVDKQRIAQACGFGIRYVNRLLFIKREAHPELYELFRQGVSGLTVKRMGRLVGHEPMEQMAEYRRSEGLRDQAVEVEQGYPVGECPAESPAAPEGTSPAATPRSGRRRFGRRRLPPRSHVRRLLEHYERAGEIHPQRRDMAVRICRHLLHGEPPPELESAELASAALGDEQAGQAP